MLSFLLGLGCSHLHFTKWSAWMSWGWLPNQLNQSGLEVLEVLSDVCLKVEFFVGGSKREAYQTDRRRQLWTSSQGESLWGLSASPLCAGQYIPIFISCHLLNSVPNFVGAWLETTYGSNNQQHERSSWLACHCLRLWAVVDCQTSCVLG